MKVFKYRMGGDSEILSRDISSLWANQFWASSFSRLNDPCEGFFHINQRMVEKLKFHAQLRDNQTKTEAEEESQVQIVDNNIALLEKLTGQVGIYSLASSGTNELMWAHYSNSHKGYCIEYDLEELTVGKKKTEAQKTLEVKYKKRVPVIDIFDYTLNFVTPVLLTKVIATKSKQWEYEKEIRVITSSEGSFQYSSTALKRIHFGLRQADTEKALIMYELRDHDVSFCQMKLKGKSYSLESVEINSDPEQLEAIEKHMELVKTIRDKFSRQNELL